MTKEQRISVYKECIGLRNGEFLKMLKADRENILEMAVETDDEKTWRSLRGEAGRLKTLIETIETSKELLEKATKDKPDMRKVY